WGTRARIRRPRRRRRRARGVRPAPRPRPRRPRRQTRRSRVSARSRRSRTSHYGVPTNVVTLWGSSVALKRALLTLLALLEAMLSAADVTHGVMLQGTAPET